jgi:vacuolar-type H+-ATPase subunit H
MKTVELLDELRELVEQSPNVLLSHKKAIDFDVIMDILDDLYQTLPEDIQEAQKILEQKNEILSEAEEESRTLRTDAESELNRLAETSDITQKAYEKSREIIETAQQNAKEIRLGARDYADEVLEEVEKYMETYLQTIQNNRQQLRGKKKPGDAPIMKAE